MDGQLHLQRTQVAADGTCKLLFDLQVSPPIAGTRPNFTLWRVGQQVLCHLESACTIAWNRPGSGTNHSITVAHAAKHLSYIHCSAQQSEVHSIGLLYVGLSPQFVGVPKECQWQAVEAFKRRKRPLQAPKS